MKQIQSKSKMLVLIMVSFLATTFALAQEGGADINVNINKGGGPTWYTSPWVWIVGAALFILLLVALLRGNGTRE